MSQASTGYSEVNDTIIDTIRRIIGDEHTLTSKSERAIRASSAAPFPIHKWEEYVPSVVALPGSTEEVAAIVKLANKHKIPVVPRGGGTGLADGAVPDKKGIMIDLKRMRHILEIDTVDRTVTVQPGINMQNLNRELKEVGMWFPDDPASYAVSVVGGRIGANGFSLINGVGGHTRDLVISQEVVLPTGEIIRVGDGPAKKIRKSSSGFPVDQLFFGHQGTLGITTEATLECFPRQEVEFPAFFGFESYEDGYEALGEIGLTGLKTLGGAVLFDEQKIQYLRRDDEAFIPQPERLKSVVATVLYGTESEVSGARDTLMAAAEKANGWYLGEELSEGDWASRHDRYAIPFHGRTSDGQVSPYSWHCEDAAINYSQLPKVKEKWHELVAETRSEYPDLVDDWGMFFYTSNPFKPWGDYLVEIDIGIREEELDEESWEAWKDLAEGIAQTSIDVGGSITSCHGSTRAGQEHLVVDEIGEGQFTLMKQVKRALDPNNIMNPGKYMLDEAYESDDNEDADEEA